MWWTPVYNNWAYLAIVEGKLRRRPLLRFAAQQQCGIWFTYCQKGATDKTHRRLVQGTYPGTSALAENPWEMWVEFMGKLPSMVFRSLCSEAAKLPSTWTPLEALLAVCQESPQQNHTEKSIALFLFATSIPLPSTPCQERTCIISDSRHQARSR